MGSRKETKRFFLNMPWSVSVPFAAMIGVPFSIMAYRHPQQFADMATGVAEAKWGSYFWMVVAIGLFLLFISSRAYAQTERRVREDYIRRLEEENARHMKALEKGEKE